MLFRNSSTADLPEVEILRPDADAYQPEVQGRREKRQAVVKKGRRSGFWGKLLAGGLAFAATASLVQHVSDQSYERGQTDSIPKIEAAQQQAEGAEASAEYFNELHRMEVARSSALEYMAVGEKLPYFKGHVEIYYAGELVVTAIEPIILSPSFGAYGTTSDAEGWQAIITHSKSSFGGLDAYVRDSRLNSYVFVADDGVVLTDQDVWSAQAGSIGFDVMRLGQDVNGVPELLNSQGMILGTTS
jgi:hypothetical protein